MSKQSIPQHQEAFVVRIVSLDYYLTKPTPGLDICYSQLAGAAIERVPVVQIFGATPGGQKTCLHLHKVMCTALGSLLLWPLERWPQHHKS